MNTSIQKLAIGVLFLLSMPALAYDFIPTDAEWLAWPAYCKARYVTLPIGESSKWTSEITRPYIEAAKLQIGTATFEAVHHYCAGTVLVVRAKYLSDEAQRKYQYRTAISETTFTLTRVPVSDPLAPLMLNNLATAYQGIGDISTAIDRLNQSIEAHPDASVSYIALGLLHRNQHNLSAAKEVLTRGNAATNDTSADLNYNLALILLELKENDAALVYAHKAYDLGYPLPGLRNKLKQLGLWTDTEKSPS